MAKLFFRYGTMNSGKSTSLIQVAHNYEETGDRAVIMKPKVDTKDAEVVSRIDVKKKVDFAIGTKDNLFQIIENELSNDRQVHCILIEEAQFLTVNQVDQLMLIVTRLNIPVIAYGLRTDFRSDAFPGAQRLLEIAHTLEEIRTKCFLCGSKALYNTRQLPDGSWTKEGDQVLIDNGEKVKYVPLCAKHFDAKVGLPNG
jgi:thymidine kinase